MKFLLFGRKGGGDISLLKPFEMKELLSLSKELIRKKNQIEKSRKLLIESLFTEISTVNDKELSLKLIKVKRDLYNKKPLSKYNGILHGIADLSKDWHNIQLLLLEFEKEKLEFKYEFNNKIEKSLIDLNKLCQENFLQNGLLFSSHILYNSIYKSKSLSLKNKKNRKLTISILKYLSRSVAKTTPFSSFNTVFYNNIYTSVVCKKPNPLSFLQINNVFFYYLKKGLLNAKLFKFGLKVKLNSNIWEEDDNLCFFLNIENNEIFKKIQRSQIIEFIKQTLSDRDYTLKDLIVKLQSEINDSEKNIIIFLDSLLLEGFIYLVFPVTHHDIQWLDLLIYYLQEEKVLHKDLIELRILKSLKIATRKCKTVQKRKILIEKSYGQALVILDRYRFRDFFKEKIKPQELFYEDVIQKVNVNNIIGFRINELTPNLRKCYNAFLPFSEKKIINEMMIDIFKTKGLFEFNLLDFYEQVYLKKEFHKHAQFILIEKINKVLSSFSLENKFIIKNNIDFEYFFTDETDNNSKPPIGAYIQPIASDWSCVALNSFSRGYGANISRFTNYIPSYQVKSILESNNYKNRNVIIADVKDASIHNVNTFPALTENVISIAQNDNLKDIFSESIVLKNIRIVLDDCEVILKNSTGKRIIPNHFSLEGLNRNSKLSRFLDLFNPFDNSGFEITLSLINDLAKKKLSNLSIVGIPRIYFGKSILLQRKKWFVERKKLSGLKFSEPDDFLLFNEWRIENGLPNRVFVKIKQRDLTPDNDDYKPQYIDFRMPIMLVLLESLISKSSSLIEFTEALPSGQDITTVTEYILNDI